MPIAKPSNPLLAIVGATGTGKSQLAVDLALRFNGEVINADAMQLYDGLPIITNKIPLNERKGVPHHLLGCVSLDEQPWRADTLVARALQTMKEIRSRGRLPILVGGTHYYTQSLLFRDTLVETSESDGEEIPTGLDHTDAGMKWPILNDSPEKILAKLREVDPVIAARWHPNDSRKIRRSLEIWLTTGKRASEVYADQEQRRKVKLGDSQTVEMEDNSKQDSSGLRFPTLLLWVHVPRELAADRLDQRVDQMMQDGLLREALDLESFVAKQESLGQTVDRTRGIYAAVGYKEFTTLLNAMRSGLDDEVELKKYLEEGVEMTKAATRRYAKTQVKWIRIKLVNALRDVGAERSMVVFDATDVTQWAPTVLEPAVGCVQAFLDSKPLPELGSSLSKELLSPLREYILGRRRELWKQQTCEVCNVTAVTEEDWQSHVKGHRHRQIVRKRMKKQTQDERQPSLPVGANG